MKRKRQLDELLAGLGAVVSERRKDLGMSQEELGQACGLHRTYISDIEHGKRNFTMGVLYAVAGPLNVTASELLDLAEEHDKD